VLGRFDAQPDAHFSSSGFVKIAHQTQFVSYLQRLAFYLHCGLFGARKEEQTVDQTVQLFAFSGVGEASTEI
jgi:hypothetical protein